MSGAGVKDFTDVFMVEDATRECHGECAGRRWQRVAGCRAAARRGCLSTAKNGCLHPAPSIRDTMCTLFPWRSCSWAAAARGAARDGPAPHRAAHKADRPGQEHAWVPALSPGGAQVWPAAGRGLSGSGQQLRPSPRHCLAALLRGALASPSPWLLAGRLRPKRLGSQPSARVGAFGRERRNKRTDPMTPDVYQVGPGSQAHCSRLLPLSASTVCSRTARTPPCPSSRPHPLPPRSCAASVRLRGK
jgi:hypothetical protein